MSSAIKLLDCTLRDGGDRNSWKFPVEVPEEIVRLLGAAEVDIIEVGYRGGSGSNKSAEVGVAGLCPDSYLNSIDVPAGSKLSVMVVPTRAPLREVTTLSDTPVGCVRIAAYPPDVPRALTYVREAKRIGLFTTLNVMAATVLESKELVSMARQADDLGADVVYMADSFGTLIPDEAGEAVSVLADAVSCAVGFHGHNNLGLALANALAAVNAGAAYIDTSLCGMARGAGNLATEQVMAYCTKAFGYAPARLETIVIASELIRSKVLDRPMVVERDELLSGLANLHFYYVDYMRRRCGELGLEVREVTDALVPHKPIKFDPALVDRVCSQLLSQLKV